MTARAMPAEHAILGLLLREEGSRHGYDLARYFSETEPLGIVLRLEPAMLYHHLKKLARAGWVTQTVEQIGSRPPRQVYHLTPEGRDELYRWLREPVAHTREIRLEFLVKLYFARIFDPGLANMLITEQREMSASQASSLRERIDAISKTEPSDDELFLRDVLELRLLQTESAARWLNDLETPA